MCSFRPVPAMYMPSGELFAPKEIGLRDLRRQPLEHRQLVAGGDVDILLAKIEKDTTSLLGSAWNSVKKGLRGLRDRFAGKRN